MPMIHIEYDDKKIQDGEVISLSNAVQKIVSGATGIEDVFVYANSAQIKVKVAPIEIFIQMSADKIVDREKLFSEIKLQLLVWKKESSFSHPINLTLMPMDWKFEVGI